MPRFAVFAFAAALLAGIACAQAQGPREAANIQLIRDYYAAYGKGDPEALRPLPKTIDPSRPDSLCLPDFRARSSGGRATDF